MYEECCDRTRQAGYEQYEISNFARPGRACRHNFEYWLGREYAGYGPGAVGSYATDGKRVRSCNLKHPTRYSEAVEESRPLAFDLEELNSETLRTEAIMLGLRLNQGLSLTDVPLGEKEIKKLVDREWAEVTNDHLRLTPAGRHFCSEVALALI
jgi:oxygen-independent coproporphyrinogen-3 oxidase